MLQVVCNHSLHHKGFFLCPVVEKMSTSRSLQYRLLEVLPTPSAAVSMWEVTARSGTRHCDQHDLIHSSHTPECTYLDDSNQGLVYHYILQIKTRTQVFKRDCLKCKVVVIKLHTNSNPMSHQGSSNRDKTFLNIEVPDSMVVDRLIWVWGVSSLNPGRIIPNTLKMLLPCLTLSI